MFNRIVLIYIICNLYQPNNGTKKFKYCLVVVVELLGATFMLNISYISYLILWVLNLMNI